MKNVIFLLVLFMLSSTAHPKEIIFGRDKSFIGIKYDFNRHTKTSNWTLLRFPIEVKTIDGFTKFEVKAYDSDNPDYTEIKIRPLFKSIKQDGRVILVDGTTIQIQIIVNQQENPTYFDFKPYIPFKNVNGDFGNINGLDFLRSIATGSLINGNIKKKIGRHVRCKSKSLYLLIKNEIKGRKFKAYSIEAKNRNDFFQVNLKPENLKIKRLSKNESFYFLADEYNLQPKWKTDIAIVVSLETNLSDIDFCSDFITLKNGRIKL